MRRSGPKVRIVKPLVAMAAAYAVVLQVFLSAFVVTQAQAAHPADALVICYGNSGTSDDTSTQQKPSRDAHIACMMMCAQMMASAVDLPTTVCLAFVFNSGKRLGLPATAGLQIAAPPSPRMSQGPPQIA